MNTTLLYLVTLLAAILLPELCAHAAAAMQRIPTNTTQDGQ